MIIVLDTSVVVELDRKNAETIEIIKLAMGKEKQLIVSTVTVSEILAGAYRKKAPSQAIAEAKMLLSQFLKVNVDGETAEKAGQYLAYLLDTKQKIEYQDVVIAATFKTANADYLLTLNKADFLVLPGLAGKVLTPSEFSSVLKAVQKQ